MVEVGNIITVALYLGVIKNGDEKIIEKTIAIKPMIINNFFHLKINKIKFIELKSLLSGFLIITALLNLYLNRYEKSKIEKFIQYTNTDIAQPFLIILYILLKLIICNDMANKELNKIIIVKFIIHEYSNCREV